MLKSISLMFVLILTAGCIKTADQVQRERRFENMTEQMKDSQGLVSDLLNQMKDMQSQLDKMNGKIEEIEYRQKNPEGLNKLNESVSLMQSQQQAEATQMLQVQNELKEQRAFLEKVTASLANVNKPAPAKKKSAKKELTEALGQVANNQFAEARINLEALIDHVDLTAGDHNKVFHGLGRTEYFSKKYEKALVYFSKIFTKYPRSSLAASSLLFIGRSLDKMGKKDEAREAFNKVMEDYPGTKEATEAKKEL